MKYKPPETNQAQWYNLAENKATKHLDIYLFGVIGGWRVNAQTFLDDIRGAGEVKTITVYLNTVGGSFYDGLPIYNMLKQHKAQVTVRVMGYALSMGSVIMLAGDRVEAAESSLIMIHRAQGGVFGDADDMTKGADVLVSHEAVIIPEYARRLGVSPEQVSELLAAETWYTASQAKEAGLIDALIEEPEGDDMAANILDESLEYVNQHFRNIPAALVQLATKQHTHQEGDEVKPEDIKAIAVEVANLLKVDTENRDYERMKNEYDALKTENAALKEQVLDLSTPAGDHTIIDENIGHTYDAGGFSAGSFS